MIEELNKYQYVFDELNKMITYLYFTRGIEFQELYVKKIDELLTRVVNDKSKYIKERNETLSNGLLSIENMLLSTKHLFEMIIFLKQDLPSKAWESLVYAQNTLHFAHMAAKNIFKVNDGHMLEIMNVYETYIFPTQVYNSIEAIYGSSTCSICGKEYGTCNHIKGRAYMGKFCFEQVKDVKEMAGLSLVTDPASKLHRITHFSDGGVMKDTFTHRKSNSQK